MSGPAVVIAGAGHAGATAAEWLRRQGHKGSIRLVGDEPFLPYQRPPLSKAWLKGEADADSLALRPAAFYDDGDIDFVSATSICSIDRARRTVSLSSGGTLAYDYLILATGAEPLALAVAGAGLEAIQPLRSANDAEALKQRLHPGHRLAVIGGGYIGLEVAASARSLGAHVIVIEREERLLARVACGLLSGFFQQYHEARGVEFMLGCAVTGFEGHDGRVCAVVAGDDRRIACDSVIVGVGARPRDAIARDCGLETADGIVVDANSRSVSDPHIFAIGDVARRPLPLYGRMYRHESVPNAIEQAKHVACAITGKPRAADECPWQWSDQFDLKLQIAGYPLDTDGVVVRGEPNDGSFAVFHLRGDRVQAVEAINFPAAFMMGRQLIINRTPVDRSRLVDPGTPLKDIAA